MNCIFYNIVAGKLPASIIFKNEHILSFMSLDQPNPFKALVIPKQHIDNTTLDWDVTPHSRKKLDSLSRKIAEKL